jgi:hypothetical protein
MIFVRSTDGLTDEETVFRKIRSMHLIKRERGGTEKCSLFFCNRHRRRPPVSHDRNKSFIISTSAVRCTTAVKSARDHMVFDPFRAQRSGAIDSNSFFHCARLL